MLDVEVAKQLGSFRVNAEFTAEEGITALFGRSGAGKSSIVNMVAGLVRPDQGVIRINGQTLFDHAEAIDVPVHCRRIGYVFQDARLFPHLTVSQNLHYGRRFRRQDDGIGTDHVVELLGIELLLDRMPETLSGGERQRVAIGRAILSRPQILLMDEPLAALDGKRRSDILPYIERLRDHFTLPILYVSHAIEEVAQIADTLVLLDEGKVVVCGQTQDLLTRLDLRPITGRYQAGVTIPTVIESQLADCGLTRVRFGERRLLIPRIEAEPGTPVKLRIRARDVSIALAPVQDCSILNQIDARIASIVIEEGPFAEAKLDTGSAVILARITAHSARKLELREGSQVTALIKSVAVDSRATKT